MTYNTKPLRRSDLIPGNGDFKKYLIKHFKKGNVNKLFYVLDILFYISESSPDTKRNSCCGVADLLHGCPCLSEWSGETVWEWPSLSADIRLYLHPHRVAEA